MCECINNVENLITEEFGGKYLGKPISQINVNKIIPFNIKGGEVKAPKVAINYTIAREGVKKQTTQVLCATFCPFCGEEYDKNEEKENEFN